jgi:hypothetical protein
MKRQTPGRLILPRRSFLQVLFGLLGGLGLPAWAAPKPVKPPPGREADFYHVKPEK